MAEHDCESHGHKPKRSETEKPYIENGEVYQVANCSVCGKGIYREGRIDWEPGWIEEG